MKEKILLVVLIPVVAAALFAGLNLTEFYQNVDLRIYDRMLHLRRPIKEREDILFVDIDDTAISEIGVFPFSRDIMARGLIVMREFGARYAVFDIEYVDTSPRGVNLDVLEREIPLVLESQFASVSNNAANLIEAIRVGSIPLSEAGDYIGLLFEENESARAAIERKVAEIAQDNDIFLGRAAYFFGNAFFTSSMLEEPEDLMTDEHKRYLLERVALARTQVREPLVRPDPPFSAPDVRPAILPILTRAKGAGFPNVIIDSDGVQRRIDLITEFDGKPFGQLGFRPLLDWMGDPEVVVTGREIRLLKAMWPDGSTRDVTIPLAPDDRFLINWPHKVYVDSFRHMTYWELARNWKLEENLVFNLGATEDLLRSILPDYYGTVLAAQQQAAEVLQEILAGGDRGQVEQYVSLRAQWVEEVAAFLDSGIDDSLLEQIRGLLQSPDVDEEIKSSYRPLLEQIPEFFGPTREVFAEYLSSRDRLSEQLNDAFCILGWTGTSTTDIGVTPFEEQFMNVGTHAAIINTILQEDFLDMVPWWISALAGVLLALGVGFFMRNLAPLTSIVVGVGASVAIVAVDALVFVLTGVYIPVLTPFLATFFSFLGLTAVKFLRSEKEKASIRNAFSHYLAPEVVKQLVDDPSRLKLGGEEKHLTAVFTDIRGFSSISERLEPTALVNLLNVYLTEMEEVLRAQKGTIDKYEGDAIIAFFGAPVEFQDHAARALRSAIHMKRMEAILNKHFMEQGQSPNELETRIGINTGPMVVGNMGSEHKMDYTIMGNSVNLAARLEGVNKQYSTWILTSQQTLDEAGDEFTVRRLDRVRVVGINEPVRLYDVVDIKSEAPQDVIEGVEVFEDALDYFEQREWDRARKRLRDVARIRPDDGPAGVFSARCDEYLKTPPAASWDGVYNLNVK